MEKLKEYLPQIITILTVIAGGGTLGYNQAGTMSRVEDTNHAVLNTATITADVMIEISALKNRVRELEARHGLEKDTQ